MKKTTRRAVLRGLGGITVGLPFLELFLPKMASAAPAPLRYVVSFAGCSLGMDGRDMVVPGTVGPIGTTTSRGLQPIVDYNLQDAASYVSNLQIDFGADGSIPPGGRAIPWHASSTCPLLCGVRSAAAGNEALQGPTSDWIVANTIGGPTLATRPVLNYRVQAAFYRGNNGSTGNDRGLMSMRDNNGTLEKVQPQFSPQIAFADLFTGFIPPDPAEAAAAQFLLTRRKSVVDLVRGDAERLNKKLGAADKIRMERHFDELRGLEAKLDAVTLPTGPECQMLMDPGSDPPIGGAVDNGDTAGYQSNGAWSDEETRANLMVDLIHMAFVCDLSRTAALMFTYAQCFLNMNPIYGHPSDLHEIGHYSLPTTDDCVSGMADGAAWHIGHVCRLMDKLRNSTDVDGNTILDNTALVLLFEGGWGDDPEQGASGSAHSSQNMGVFVGGKAGGLNTTAGHIDGGGAHPVQCINSVMGALGVPGQLGEVSGTIPGLVG